MITMGSAPWRQALDHLETAQPRHLEIQQHQVGLETLDLDQGIVAVRGLADHLDIRHRAQFVPQHLAGDRLVIHDQGAYWRVAHLLIEALAIFSTPAIFVAPQPGRLARPFIGISSPLPAQFQAVCQNWLGPLKATLPILEP